MGRQFFVGGNFKSNGTIASIKSIIDNLNSSSLDPNVVISPPAIYLLLTKDLVGNGIKAAAQNVYDKGNGAYTGEISAEQLKDAGIEWVIIGHSERRSLMGEDDKFVASKTKAAIKEGLSVILCIGESLEERETGVTLDVVTRQLKAVAEEIEPSNWSKVVIAYEPVWAIGTGKVATTQQAQDVHKAIREWLKTTVSGEAAESTRILYGGSVTDKNSKELATQPDVDGFLVGGASLKPAFTEIINSAL